VRRPESGSLDTVGKCVVQENYGDVQAPKSLEECQKPFKIGRQSIFRWDDYRNSELRIQILLKLSLHSMQFFITIEGEISIRGNAVQKVRDCFGIASTRFDVVEVVHIVRDPVSSSLNSGTLLFVVFGVTGQSCDR
jgi:hypothetical protein